MDTTPITFPTVYPPTAPSDLDYYSILQDKPDKFSCNQYVIHNKTHLIYGGYEGIPENLLINFLGWLLLLSLFTVLRKKAWNYGRLALVQKYESRWTQLFYGKETDTGKIAGEADSVSSLEFNMHIDKGLFSWIPALFKIKDEQILAKSERDAVSYLSFQRHIIVYMMIVCVISIVIVLPINFQGTLEGGEKEFGHTTLANLNPQSRLMWVHVTLAFLFLPLGIFFTRRFSKKLELREVTTSVSRTLMITRVPRRACHKDTILKHFQEAYPEMEVQDVQFAYNIRSLIAFDKEREVALNARMYCEAYLKETNRRLDMRPYRGGVICGCCDIFGCPTVDAIEYYSEEEARLANHVENEKIKALQRPTGVAFVTFDNIENAKKVMCDHKTKCDCLRVMPVSSVSVELKPHNWIIRVAPAPEDIYWANLSVTNRHWWLKAVIINIMLFVVLFFLTTPAVIINGLDNIFVSDKLHSMSPVLSEFLPTLLLWTMAALMPVIVSYSDQFMSHWTRSTENHSIMRKTFIFLLFMVIILPSLGLTSAKGFMEWLVKQNSQNETFRWECIFLPDNGAFFVNYVITSAFIGTSLELIRFPELFMYIVRLALSRSEAETASVRRAILYEFPFGVQYAWMLLIFAMTIIYSISCPLITPFGTLYMIFKHLVDKYNIYFAYGPSRISRNIHTSAINFVIVSIVCLQLSLLFFSIVRQGLKKDITIYSIVLLIITCLVFITHNAFHWFKDLSPVEYKKFADGQVNGDSASVSDDGHDEEITTTEVACQFVPSVLRDAPTGVESSYSFIAQPRNYGTRPQEEDGFTVDSGTIMNGDVSPNTREREQADLYQDYSQPKDSRLSTGEVVWQADLSKNCEDKCEATGGLSGHYQASVHFPSSDVAVVNTGQGTLHVLETGDRNTTHSWLLSFECSTEKGVIAHTSLLNGDDDKRFLHCLLVAVTTPNNLINNPEYVIIDEKLENTKDSALHLIHWLTITNNGASWELNRTRTVAGEGTIEYCSLDEMATGLLILCHKNYSFVSDSSQPLTKPDLHSQEEASPFTYTQNDEIITVVMNVDTVLKEEVKVEVTTQELSIHILDKQILRGHFQHPVEANAATWTLVDGKLEIILTKMSAGVTWQGIFYSPDVDEEEILDHQIVEDVNQRLAHLTSNKWNPSPDLEKPAYNACQLEACDEASEDLLLVRLDGSSHQLSNLGHLGPTQHLFNSQKDKSVAPQEAEGEKDDVYPACAVTRSQTRRDTKDPGDINHPILGLDTLFTTPDNKAHEVTLPAFCLRNDVDGVLWQPSGVDTFTHTATFNAFGYVKASKTMAKFTCASADASYVAVADVKSHIYIFFQPEAFGGELRNRKSGKRINTVARQLVISLETHSEILGIHASPGVLFVLTDETLYAYCICNL